ncbi:MAG TPA: MBL fold metallo-hydrolase [Polyangia bacterium]|nr:MBL fold metallo-hydrolase [Polyangia bacterium]
MKTLLWLALLAGTAAAQPADPSKVEIKIVKLAGSVSMLEGSGGNIGVSVGDDGVFLIDDQFAPLTPKIRAAVETLSKKPLRFVFNTHWHGDHTGGNENLANAGAIVVAHDNVRKRLSSEQFMSLMNRHFPPAPARALPIVTFNDEVTFHLNGDEIHVFHVARAHTDGDAIVHFRKANVVHTGDVFLSAGYPLVDVDSGGTFDGFIAAADRLLAITDAQTRIIPGHGPPADRARLAAWREMLVTVRARVKKLADAGKKLDEIKAAKPTADLDGEWAKGFIKPELVVDFAYKSVTAK